MMCSGGKTSCETRLQYNGTSVNVGQPEYKEKQSMDRAPWDNQCCVTTPFYLCTPPMGSYSVCGSLLSDKWRKSEI